ncbi:hypothetical protein LSAT2_031044 [Lamellibrachia satsuma]|nr:hypothetical protein LSAT2_031044 [Lamellibrachia satsuma]
MTFVLWNNYEERIVNLDVEGDVWLPRIHTFSSLMAVLLGLGFFSNVYIFWITTRRRFPVRWDTIRLFLRYSSVVDVSLCFVLGSVALWPLMVFHTGQATTVTLHCARYDFNLLLLGCVLFIACGVLVVARQVITMFTFDLEMELLRQNHKRTMKLLVTVAVAGVVCFVAWRLLEIHQPVIDLPLCFIVGSMSSRPIYLLLVPVTVNIVVHANERRPVVECLPVILGKLSDNSKLVEHLPQSSEEENGLTEVSDSRWKRLIIVLHVAVVTWFILAAGMATAGVLTEPLNIYTLLVLTGTTSLTSAWNAFAIFRYWT